MTRERLGKMLLPDELMVNLLETMIPLTKWLFSECQDLDSIVPPEDTGLRQFDDLRASGIKSVRELAEVLEQEYDGDYDYENLAQAVFWKFLALQGF